MDITRRKHSEKNKRIRKELKDKIFDKLGNACTICKNIDPDVLQIDHIRGKGYEEMKIFGGNSLSYYRHVLKHLNENKYQLLCANCNWKKRVINNEKYSKY